ncbi:hypothetical protein [Rhodothermus profundi]|uniref:Uncharacterized protein n=1 Tax=Rhodothermus profundi TaxID=633813 RepID=A0A1M6TVJ0_9BACT|nr:hypothetical protein [Rhodothermus profundi]SHK60913.1 hypothetical protein SAMN04488087_1550 [Rhodothermus profundi]
MVHLTGASARWLKPTAGLLWLMLLGQMAAAQSVWTVQTGFVRDVSRYRWTAGLHLMPVVGSWRLTWQQRFVSDAFLYGAGQLDFRDESWANWTFTPTGSFVLQPRLFGQIAWFNQSRVLTQQALAGLRYQPYAGFWLEPALGFALDQRPGVGGNAPLTPLQTDYGPALSLRLGWRPSTPAGYTLRLESGSLLQYLTPRRGLTAYVDFLFQRQVDALDFHVQLRGARFRRDTYQAVSFLNRSVATPPQAVEATWSDTLQGTFAAQLSLHPHLLLRGRLSGQWFRRQVRFLQTPEDALFFNTRFDHRQLDGALALLYSQKKLRLAIELETGAEEEVRTLTNRATLPAAQAFQKALLLRQADYARGYLTLSGQGWLETGRLTVGLRAYATILRHDTPEVNPDDRDELQQLARIDLRLHLTSALALELGLEGSRYHLVYLNAVRSAENYVQRTLRLQPRLHWTPSATTRLSLQGEVRAAYTVDDFVLPGRQRQDQAARELSYRLQTEQALTPRLRIRLEGAYTELRLGRLLWDRFAEIPFDTLRTYTGWLQLETHTGSLRSSVGFRIFLRRDYMARLLIAYTNAEGSPATVNRPGQLWIVQLGPTCRLNWQLGRTLTFSLEGWLMLQRLHRRLYGPLPEASAERIRKAAWNGPRTRIPNLTFSLTWQR